MMATTMSSSISVKPLDFFNIYSSSFKVNPRSAFIRDYILRKIHAIY